MITFLDLVQQDEFRKFVSKKLAKETNKLQYSFPSSFPPLFKYCTFSKYAVDNVINGHATATSVGEFNDLFDGAIHQYGSQEERIQAAEKEWTELERKRIAAGLPENLISHEKYIDIWINHLKTDSRIKFRLLDFLGTYVCCFSSRFDSTLMWAHYAKSNTGMCIEYDFNVPSANLLQNKLIFPVAYSELPVNIQDLLDDEERKVFEYPLDAAILCSALNKSDVWAYENEWRLVLILAFEKRDTQRIPIVVPVPKSISFGYHFLKSFFYYDFDNTQEREVAEENIQEFSLLLNYIEKEKIATFITIPSIGKYNLSRNAISIERLKNLVDKHFRNNAPEGMRYYYVVHDELMDILEEGM